MIVCDTESAPCFVHLCIYINSERWLMHLLITDLVYPNTSYIMLFLELNLQRNNGNVELKSNLTNGQLKVVQ